jgi:hypothetical protein
VSDQQQEQSFEDVLINRLAQRLGVATAQVEALTMQLESAQARIQQLEAMTEPHPPMSNGFSDAYEGAAIV